MTALSGEEERSSPDREPSVVQQNRSIEIVDRRIDSRDLFRDTREINISHGGETYRLRLTAQNKLILTK